MNRLLLMLSLLSVTNQVVTVSVTKRIVKIVYQPYGPQMCRQVSEGSVHSFAYIKEDLSCRQISGIDPNNITQHSTEVFVTSLKDNMLANHTPKPPRNESCDSSSEGNGVFKMLHDLTGGLHHKYTSVLHLACQEGNLCVVQSIVSHRLVDINCPGPRGATPIMTAVSNGQNTVFDFLVHMGSDLTASDYDHNNVLHTACAVGNIDVARELIVTHNYDVDSTGWHGWTPAMYAGSVGHTEVVALLLKEGCNYIKVDEKNDNLLHIACLGGVVNTVKYILKQDIISTECKGSSGRTPVMHAVYMGHTAVVDLLISNSCNLTATDNEGDNILHLACLRVNVIMVEYMLKLDIVSIDSRGFRGRTPLMLAAELGHQNVVELLISKNCDVKATDDDGNNILFTAIRGGVVNMVKYIIGQNLVDIRRRGFRGRTPVMEAAQDGNIGIIGFLLSKKCDTKATDDDGSNVLHLACIGGNVRMVKHVLDLDIVSIDSRGYHGRTPAMTAALRGHRHVFRFLLSRNCNMEEVDSDGNNVLHMACVGGDIVIVRNILKLDIKKLNAMNKSGLTPGQIAEKKGQRDIVALLRAKKYQ